MKTKAKGKSKSTKPRVSRKSKKATAEQAAVKKYTATEQVKGLRKYFTIHAGESVIEICVPRVLGRTEIVVDNQRVL